MSIDRFILVVALVVLAFIGGGAAYDLLLRRRASREQTRREQQVFGDAHETKGLRYAIILILLLVAVNSGLLYAYAKTQHWDDLAVEFFAAVFALSGAGLIGQIVFESLLREQLFARTSRILTSIILTEKNVLANLFANGKLDEIVQRILQIRSQSDTFGTALSNWLAQYLVEDLADSGKKPYFRPPRQGFSDEICFSEFQAPSEDQQILNDYYLVTEHLEFRTRLPLPKITIGCARTRNALYEFFDDVTCIYRWALFEDDHRFSALINLGRLFDAELTIDGKRCEKTTPGITLRGYEITFVNPLLVSQRLRTARDSAKIDTKPESSWSDEVQVEIDITTLHPKREHFLSVHLAYPADEASIRFTFSDTPLTTVNTIHFFTALSPQIRSQKRANGTGDEYIAVTAKGSNWIFPDAGVVFVWD